MTKKKLTVRQLEVLDFIRDFHEREKMMPTYAEIAEAFNSTASSVFVIVKKLAERGYIQTNRKPRCMKLL